MIAGIKLFGVCHDSEIAACSLRSPKNHDATTTLDKMSGTSPGRHHGPCTVLSLITISSEGFWSPLE